MSGEESMASRDHAQGEQRQAETEGLSFEQARNADSVILHDENGAHPAWWDHWTSQWRTGGGEVLSTEGFVTFTAR